MDLKVGSVPLAAGALGGEVPGDGPGPDGPDGPDGPGGLGKARVGLCGARARRPGRGGGTGSCFTSLG